MTYDDFLHRLIKEGIAAAKKDYQSDEDNNRGKLAGSIDGFEACRGKQPIEILKLLEDARVKGHQAFIRVHEKEISDFEYWKVRCCEMEIEWVANCVSAMLVNQGLQPIVYPTYRAVMAVAKIVGVKEPG